MMIILVPMVSFIEAPLALFSKIEITIVSEKYTSEIWVDANKIEFQGVIDWSKNQEIEPTLEKTSCLCYQSTGN